MNNVKDRQGTLMGVYCTVNTTLKRHQVVPILGRRGKTGSKRKGALLLANKCSPPSEGGGGGGGQETIGHKRKAQKGLILTETPLRNSIAQKSYHQCQKT